MLFIVVVYYVKNQPFIFSINDIFLILTLLTLSAILLS